MPPFFKIKFIEGNIRSHPWEAAREILSIRKSINQIEYEYNAIESFRKQGEKGIESGFTRHKAHTLILTSFYLLEEDFRSKDLRVEISPYQGFVNVDFATARSAISQIFSNAIKFCKPDSQITIGFVEIKDYVNIKFEMVSRYFTNDEKKNFTRKKFRGTNSTGTDGQGLGLFAAQRMMSLNAGTLEINSKEATRFTSQGNNFSQNEFILSFRSL